MPLEAPPAGAPQARRQGGRLLKALQGRGQGGRIAGGDHEAVLVMVDQVSRSTRPGHHHRNAGPPRLQDHQPQRVGAGRVNQGRGPGQDRVPLWPTGRMDEKDALAGGRRQRADGQEHMAVGLSHENQVLAAATGYLQGVSGEKSHGALVGGQRSRLEQIGSRQIEMWRGAWVGAGEGIQLESGPSDPDLLRRDTQPVQGADFGGGHGGHAPRPPQEAAGARAEDLVAGAGSQEGRVQKRDGQERQTLAPGKADGRLEEMVVRQDSGHHEMEGTILLLGMPAKEPAISPDQDMGEARGRPPAHRSPA